MTSSNLSFAVTNGPFGKEGICHSVSRVTGAEVWAALRGKTSDKAVTAQ